MWWPAPLAIVLFSGFFWTLNYLIKRSIFTKTEEKEVLSPSDVWIIPGTTATLLPLFAVYAWVPNTWVIVTVSAALPVLSTLVLGWIRGNQSVSAVLLLGANGAGVALLYLTNSLIFLSKCIDQAGLQSPEHRIAALSYCAEMSRFWFNAWVAMSFGILTTFGGILVSIFVLKTEDLIEKSTANIDVRKHRKVLAILYSVSIMWMLLAGFAEVGAPAVQALNRLANLGSLMQ